MKTIQVNFQENWHIDQRKAAINQAVEAQMPFELKSILIESEIDDSEQEYTGGSMQLLTARRAIISIEAR